MGFASFPIILHKEEANAGIGEPVGLFVNYVNTLLRGGVPAEGLPGAFLDLYALDFYEAQVRNGGHSQFVGNSGGRLRANLEHALRGAQMLGMPELVQVLRECRDWCEANPVERDRQDGWSHRAVVLDALDNRFYAMEYDDVAYASFVVEQPEKVQGWIKAATEATEFRARCKYRLLAGAWLLKQPNTELLPGGDIEAAVERILKQHARAS